jgi:hypothetical protein
MSGNGVTNFSFTEGNVLPNTVTTATSGGDNINVFKAIFEPAAQTGGKKHRKSCGKKRKSMRKIKKNKSKKNKSRKNTRRNRRK